MFSILEIWISIAVGFVFGILFRSAFTQVRNDKIYTQEYVDNILHQWKDSTETWYKICKNLEDTIKKLLSDIQELRRG